MLMIVEVHKKLLNRLQQYKKKNNSKAASSSSTDDMNRKNVSYKVTDLG